MPDQTEPARDRITIAVYRTNAEQALQLQITRANSEGIGMGYRLAGPKHYNLGVTELLEHELTERDAVEVRAMLDAVFPPKPPLDEGERKFLAFALDLAFDEMASRGNEFGDDDEAALAALRKLAEGGAR